MYISSWRGRNTNVEHDEFLRLCNDIHSSVFCMCLCSGKDCLIEEWMYCFVYIKIGSYKEISWCFIVGNYKSTVMGNPSFWHHQFDKKMSIEEIFKYIENHDKSTLKRKK